MVRASICTIGDEILIGQIIDTNSSHISRALNGIGVKVNRMLSISDNLECIIQGLSDELAENDIVIVTGGLGPTKDDITKNALAKLSGTETWKTDHRQLDIIHKILSSRGLDVLDINIQQASVPDTCEVIPNRLGTAPIMVFHFPDSKFGHKPTLYSLPGVPFEALGSLNDVLEDIKTHYRTSDIYHKTIMTYGLAESALSKKIEEWEDNLPDDIHLAYLPNPLSGIKLRLSIYGGKKEDQEKRISQEISKLNKIIGEYIYSYEESTLEESIGKLLKDYGKSVAVAESCTGGTISSMLTSVPGASEYYKGSVTSYANEVKTEVLGVPSEIINEFGAVSSECAGAMAEGVRKLMNTDFSVATTGIAGPGGGSEMKPTGLVWIGISSKNGVKTYSYLFKNDRKRNIERFASSAMHLLLKTIKNECNSLK